MPNPRKSPAPSGIMTVRDASRMGGERGGKRGGETTKERHGPQFYEEIGRKGG